MNTPSPTHSRQAGSPAPSARKQTDDQRGQGKGMPVKVPATGRSRPGRAETPADASVEASLALPHERDQSLDMTEAPPDPHIQRASRDLRRGLQDTGKSAPMDTAYDRLKR